MMNEMIAHVGHMLQYDGALHWCFLIALFGAMISITWVIQRVLMPLLELVRMTEGIAQGNFSTFDTKIDGIPEIDQLRQTLHEMMQQLRMANEREYAYRNALTDSQEHERMRIAHEIHDDTIQSLVLVAHHIERANNELGEDLETVQHLKNARQQLVGIIERLRGLIGNLRPTVLDELGLVMALEMLCETSPTLEFSVMGKEYEIEHTQELALFRTAQEAIRNAERHANASLIRATLIYGENGVTLEIRDDGIGFDIPQQLQEFASRGHYGLLGIRERISHLGGNLQLISQAASGTQLTAVFPLQPNAT